MKTNVKKYTDRQLLERVSSLDSFSGFPTGYWILGVRSNEDAYNKPDDKFYVFKGIEFIMVTSGTTNSGDYGILNYRKWNRKGVFVLKSDEFYYDMWANGKHKNKMDALVQVSSVKGYRDGNKDKKTDEIGEMEEGLFGINFHGMSYKSKTFVKKYIGAWSVGCQVCNIATAYYSILTLVKNQKRISYCLLKEF